MLKQGLNEQQRQRALEIILALESDYVPAGMPQVQKPSTAWFWWFAGIGLAISTLISFPPRTQIGIGRGESRIKQWKAWIRFISVFIPSSILLPLLIDRLRNVIF